jgi:hypothetical protein
MNLVFLSPHFPPSHLSFCRALRARGVNVLGVGDVPREAVSPELHAVLGDYVHVRDLGDEDTMVRALGLLTFRHGRIDRIESLNEHWLEIEGRLRGAFNTVGLHGDRAVLYRKKSGMAEVLRAHGLEGPPEALVNTADDLRRFAETHPLPLFMKPDRGVGAEGAFPIRDAAALAQAIAAAPFAEPMVVQTFIEGRLTTYDGLTNNEGEVVFASSLIYSDTVFDIRNEQRNVYFYSRRELPEALVGLGEQVVKAFAVPGRFFHLEFFERPDGSFLPLEMNLRPPGGFCVDLMNFACDIDLYELWARIMAGERVAPLTVHRPFHAAHIGRRGDTYAVPADEVHRVAGTALLARPWVPPGLSLMGNPIFLIRHSDEGALHELAGRLLTPA